MKFAVVVSLLAFAIACNGAPSESKKTLPINKAETHVKNEQAKAKFDPKAEEDCDDKAKKPIEIKEETISLTGNTGCSLDEMQAKP